MHGTPAQSNRVLPLIIISPSAVHFSNVIKTNQISSEREAIHDKKKKKIHRTSLHTVPQNTFRVNEVQTEPDHRSSSLIS